VARVSYPRALRIQEGVFGASYLNSEILIRLDGTVKDHQFDGLWLAGGQLQHPFTRNGCDLRSAFIASGHHATGETNDARLEPARVILIGHFKSFEDHSDGESLVPRHSLFYSFPRDELAFETYVS
jgi:hypothetical protein